MWKVFEPQDTDAKRLRLSTLDSGRGVMSTDPPPHQIWGRHDGAGTSWADAKSRAANSRFEGHLDYRRDDSRKMQALQSEAFVPKRCRRAEFSFLWTARTIAPRHTTMSTPFLPLTATFFRRGNERSRRRCDPRSARAVLDSPRADGPYPRSLQRRRGHETHLSAEQPPPPEDARLPGEDEPPRTGASF